MTRFSVFSPLNFLDFGCAPFEFFERPFITVCINLQQKYKPRFQAWGLFLLRPVCALARGLVRVHPEDGIVVLRGQGLAGLLGQTEQPGGKRVGQTSGVGAGQHGHAADVAGRVARRQIDQVGVPHAVVLK